MTLVGNIHANLVFDRRTRVLAAAIAKAIPPASRTVLDVGCGDGTIAALVMQLRPELSVVGVDILIRPDTKIPVQPFDGIALPFDRDSIDVVMFVDVLHHTDDPGVLLKEAHRVARGSVVLKDHTSDSLLSGPILRFMDWVGNAHHGVILPYNYWPTTKWDTTFRQIGLNKEEWTRDLGLYPFPASLVFERGLHFVARLNVGKAT